VIVKTLEETPKDATHWSTRSMAKATGMSQSAVSRIWKAFTLKPHLVDDFKLSPDPQFIDKSKTSSACTSIRPTPQLCSASTRRPRSKRSIARHPYCR
jgi:transcriptional regulator with XRE-family HTH domain